MTPHRDAPYLLICRQQIESKLGWPTASVWRDFEFTVLSEKIYEETSVQLSTTTLKRIFGKIRYESLPSSATLNSLAQYLGFENWMDFKINQHVPTESPVKKSFRLTVKLRSSKISLITLITIFILAVPGFFFLSGSSSSAIPVEQVLFTSRPIAEGLPNSVVFKTDLKGIRSRDIYIQQSWDSTRTVRLVEGQTEATGIYYIPGYFRARLIVDKKTIKEHDLFIRSHGWIATIDKPLIPDYIGKQDLLFDGEMKISDTTIEKIKSLEKPAMLTYHLVQPFKFLHSDQFTFRSSFQNTYGDGLAVCKTVKVFILCTKGAFIIPFTIPGCISEINLKLNDKTWNGKSNDLSAFGVDASKKILLEIRCEKREVSILLNDKLVRVEKYQADAGDIVGLRYSFSGAGLVDDILLQNGKGDIVYQETFGH